MSERRISGSTRKTRASTGVTRSKSTISADKKSYRFIGVSLSGGKSDKACVAILEYFPEHKKIFLARLFEKIKTEEIISADLKIHEIITQFGKEVESVAFDVPLTLPKCLRCSLPCPGYEVCNLDEIKWLRNFYQEVNKGKKPKKMFTPYTQRCAESFVSHALEEPFDIHHTLGSNVAPLAARAQFIQRRLDLKCIEVFPKLSVWRLGQKLKVPKSHLRFHKHIVGGDESRKIFLQHLCDREGVFIYQQDLRAMVENNHAFEALICAYTGYLKFLGQTEARPSGFPKKEAWVEFPKT
jgi:hypothetical protein